MLAAGEEVARPVISPFYWAMFTIAAETERNLALFMSAIPGSIVGCGKADVRVTDIDSVARFLEVHEKVLLLCEFLQGEYECAPQYFRDHWPEHRLINFAVYVKISMDRFSKSFDRDGAEVKIGGKGIAISIPAAPKEFKGLVTWVYYVALGEELFGKWQLEMESARIMAAANPEIKARLRAAGIGTDAGG